MANINLVANEARGSVPTFGATATVERDAHGVYLNLPRTEGVVDAKSAVALADGLYAAAGATRAATPATPSMKGSYVVQDESGLTLFDANGTALGTFEEQVRYAFFPTE